MLLILTEAEASRSFEFEATLARSARDSQGYTVKFYLEKKKKNKQKVNPTLQMRKLKRALVFLKE